jgi:SAM-dependent methyltransferase
LERMVPHVDQGTVVEFGCGSGFVLEFLSERFPQSVFVGADRSSERLETLASRHIPNVIPVRAEITEPVFPRGTFTVALFVGVLHEIYSELGEAKAGDMLKIARDVLREKGTVIVQDFLKPPPIHVDVTFKKRAAYEKFLRFASEFRPRKIDFTDSGMTVGLDISDGVEFLSKYGSPDEEDWAHEMQETHFCFAEGDYRKMAERAGFRVKAEEKLPARAGKIAGLREDMEFDFAMEYAWIQMVLVKV